MEQKRLEYLTKKYEKKLHPATGEGMPGVAGQKPGGMAKGPRGRNAANMSPAKPKNIKKTLGRLFSYIAKDKWKLIIVCICVIAGTVAGLAGSYMLRPIINNFIARLNN